jgi:hypothetical protein
MAGATLWCAYAGWLVWYNDANGCGYEDRMPTECPGNVSTCALELSSKCMPVIHITRLNYHQVKFQFIAVEYNENRLRFISCNDIINHILYNTALVG